MEEPKKYFSQNRSNGDNQKSLLKRIKQRANRAKMESQIDMKDLNYIVEQNIYSQTVIEMVAKGILNSQGNNKTSTRVFFIESQQDQIAFRQLSQLCKKQSQVCLFFKLIGHWHLFVIERDVLGTTLKIYADKSELKIIKVIEKLKKIKISIRQERQMNYWSSGLKTNIADVLCLKNFEEHIMKKSKNMSQNPMNYSILNENQLSLIKSDLKLYVVKALISKRLQDFVDLKLSTQYIQQRLQNASKVREKLEQPTKLFIQQFNKENEKMKNDDDCVLSPEYIERVNLYKKTILENKLQIESLSQQRINKQNPSNEKSSQQKSSGDQALKELNFIIKIMNGVYLTRKSLQIYQKIASVFQISRETFQKSIKEQMLKDKSNKKQPELCFPRPLKEIKTVDKKNVQPKQLQRSDQQILKFVCQSFTSHQKQSFSDSFLQIKTHCQKWSRKTMQEIQNWAISHKDKHMTLPEKIQCIGVMNQAYLLLKGYPLRSTQIAAVISLIMTEKDTGKLLQVETGEGKTTIVFLIATIKALEGYFVDVITSNQVLAQQGIKSNQNLYCLFGLSADHNNKQKPQDMNSQKRKAKNARKCYSANIVYGSISNFQFDYMTHEFEGHDTRGSRKFGFSILDEVDSLIIDNGNHIAKLAEPFSGMGYLQYIYINIWKAIVEAEEQETKKVESALNQLNATKNHENKQIEEYQQNYCKLANEISAAMKRKVMESNPIDFSMVPFHLHDYCKSMTEKWIDSAMAARYEYREKQQYILKYDQKNNQTSIVPMDYLNTGVTLHNTMWDNGLHQFLQLKHNILLTNESLTTCFISNLGYIKLYENRMYGMTGTLGSTVEQNFFKINYKVSFGKIPTFREKKLKYQESSLMTNSAWIEKIVVSTFEQVEHLRSVLIICKTIKDLQTLQKNIIMYRDICSNKELIKIKTYQNEQESEITQEAVGNGEIILATNIAGRGTDLKSTESLEIYGGLHVIISFLASNKRVQDQIIGRTARQGNQGSVQYILKESDLQEIGISVLSSQQRVTFQEIFAHRNKCQRIRLKQIQTKRVPEINFKDLIFTYFLEQVKKMREKNCDKEEQQFILQDLKQQWAFWLRQFDEKESFENLNPKYEYKKFQAKQQVKQNLSGKIAFNFFNAINQAEFFLADQNIKKAKESLQNAKSICSNQQNKGMKTSLYIKFFEVSIQQGGQIMQKFKKAIGKLFFIDVSIDRQYKKKANEYLQLAKKQINIEREFLKTKIIGQASSIQSNKFDKILTSKQNSKNEFVSHLNSKMNALDLVYNQIENLFSTMNTSIDSQVSINQRIPNYFKNQKLETKDQQVIKNGISLHVFQQLEEIGLQVTYSLKCVYDVPEDIIHASQVQIGLGIVAVISATAFINLAPILGPAGSTLITEGICDLAYQLLSQGNPQFNMKQYIKSKVIDYAVSLATFGLSAIVSSQKIMMKAIEKCKNMAKWLRECKNFKWLCAKLANTFEKLGEFLTKVLIAQKQQLKKTQKISKCYFKQKAIEFGKKFVFNKVQSFVMTNVIQNRLNYILDFFNPYIEKRVQEIIEREISKKQLKLVSNQKFPQVVKTAMKCSEIKKIYDTFCTIIKFCSSNFQYLGIEMITFGYEVVSCTKTFCKNFNQINKDQKEIEITQNIINNRIAYMKYQMSSYIKNLIKSILRNYASRYVVEPMMSAFWGFVQNGLTKNKQKKEEQICRMKNVEFLSLPQIIQALKIIGLNQEDPTLQEIDKAYEKATKISQKDENSSSETYEIFFRINHAYRLLKAYMSQNSLKYDNNLSQKKVIESPQKEREKKNQHESNSTSLNQGKLTQKSQGENFCSKAKLSSLIKQNFRQRAINERLIDGEAKNFEQGIKEINQLCERPSALQIQTNPKQTLRMMAKRNANDRL